MRFNVWTGVSILLILAALGFYLDMGIVNDGWTDIGVYSVTIVLLGLGLFGLLASARTDPAGR